MAQRCEVCETFRPTGDLKPGRELLEVRFGERAVDLCRAHAGIAENSGVETFDALRELFAESQGQRSFVSRRGRSTALLNREPRTVGRRQSDARR